MSEGKSAERRGFLQNVYTGSREYFVLRGGVLQIKQAPGSRDICGVYLAHGSTVSLSANNVLELTSRVPYAQEYILGASNAAEAEDWYDAIQAVIKGEAAKMKRLKEFLEQGCTMHKYNYSNSKRSRRYFWVGDDGRELCWGRAKGEDTQKVNLRECIGIICGPMTTTFQRCTNIEDPSWSCFSLLFMGRTLDLAVAGDLQVHAWFLGMQHLISCHGIGSMPIMSEAQFLTRKVQLKLMDAAHRKGLVLGRYLIQHVRAQASATGRGPKSLGANALVAGGRLATPMQTFPVDSKATQGASMSSRKEKKSDGPDTKAVGDLQERAIDLQAALRNLKAQHAAAEAALKVEAPAGTRKKAATVALRAAGLKTLHGQCANLEAEVQRLNEAGDQMGSTAKVADKVERSVQKLQVKFEETEAKRVALEKELATAKSSTSTFTGEQAGSSSAETEAKQKSQQLQKQIQDMEKRLKDAQGNAASDAAAALNKEQAAAIAASEQERLTLAQKLEAIDLDCKKVAAEEKASSEKLNRILSMNAKLDTAVAPLRNAASKLKSEQQRAKAELTKASFGADIQKVVELTGRMAQEGEKMQVNYKAAMEDRKKLHNLVLDLKGNIRVFVRCRPINAKELPGEPDGEATVSMSEQIKIGVYDGSHARRKWFEFDQAFDPSTTQSAVFEEAKPLATSVLDGYNVCVFAYGQTGSGKTHTMAGTQADPGLNTRVLKELFRIREERAGEYDISLTLAITEIYNETVKDLLCPSSKKLEVKINNDGSCSVPGLTEVNVTGVQDVLKCINDAQKNRSTSATDMNEQSSRSHSIVTVRTQCTLRGGDTYVGKVNLIDLAGSENVGKSGVTGAGMKEAQNINKSLSALGDVIQSLVAKSSHTPYRNSKLTMMLKDSLGGDSKTLMIVCCSPAQTNVTETLSSLNFASRARNVELGKAKRNVAG